MGLIYRLKEASFLIFVFFSVFLFYFVPHLRNLVFQQCVEHVDYSPTHAHTNLIIIQDGREILIPANIGISNDCMHPLHTHDTTGLIHMEYPYPMPFFLGDFFNVMGVSFDNSQLGAFRTFDGYTIKVFRNGKEIKGVYRWILLKNLDKIEIHIEKSKK